MSSKLTLKTPKGTVDFSDKDMAIREKMFAEIVKVFKRHGAVTIDTPVFEMKEILTGKYGEDSKLIYDLKDQGGEICSLRYDLTVPFARFLAMNGSVYQNIKRYQIGKVYRRDQPSVAKGRMREFFQCDFDIAGEYEAMVPDAEAVRVMVEILTALKIGNFLIKINHRKILDGMFEVCGVPKESLRAISSAVDKLDKMPWEEVKKEMVEQKGLDASVADKIGEYVKLRGGAEVCELLAKDENLIANAAAAQGIEDMKKMFKYLALFGVENYASFDLSLARGLDYYTGVIYEAVFTNTESDDTSGIGSIAAGGRYDDLVGMFGGKKIPCVGISIGVERIFSLLKKQTKVETIKANEVEVYVICPRDGLLEERMKIATELWDNGIKTEFAYKAKPRQQTQFDTCRKQQIPIAVIINSADLAQGKVKLQDMNGVTEEKEKLVNRSDVVAEVKSLLEKIK
ncbi:Cytoplasmic and mitochondrial histidine tRNA synthetase [Nowakowskiella sp. JEL0407]|nr:Cytoplasmic and mitochondrial histidine tRNA synthetase [Nowakowskiella sp. JEL0407]